MSRVVDPFKPLRAAYTKALRSQEAHRKAHVANLRAMLREHPELARSTLRALEAVER